MSTPPKRRERSLSDVKASVVSVPPKVRTATFTEKKKAIRSVLQVKPKISGDDQTQEDKPHKSVLNLVEALMKETQRLKDAVKQQAKKQQLTTQYLSTIHQTHQTQIKTLLTKLNQSEQNRHQLFTNIAKILEQCETKRVYSQTSGKVNQVSFTTEQINALNGLLSEAESVSFDIEKDFAEFPSFDDWVTAQTNRDTENSEDEVELRPEGEETEEIEVLPETTEEEAPNPDDCSLEHIEIQTGLMPLEPRVNGYRIENGNLNYFDATTVQPELFNGLIESNKDIPYYRSFYYGKPHTNYIVEDPNQGIFFISILGEGAVKEVSKSFGTIVRHEGGLVVGPRLRRKKIIQNFNISPNATWKEIKDSSFSVQLQDLEIKDLKVRHRNKFALLYVKEGQNQEEMFSNTDGSEDWEEFLEFLGDKVPLKGWKKYNGGLDTETGTTGTHSIYLQYCGVEVMFHVSTMIPVSESDEQQVERKRHLGNDVVVLVFKEGKDPFSPTIIRSHFNSIFIVVQKYHNPQDEENTYYQLAVASREIVEPFPPFLPESPVFKKNKALRNFLICKMINGERQTYQTSEFSSRLGRARTGVMKAVAKDYLKGK